MCYHGAGIDDVSASKISDWIVNCREIFEFDFAMATWSDFILIASPLPTLTVHSTN